MTIWLKASFPHHDGQGIDRNKLILTQILVKFAGGGEWGFLNFCIFEEKIMLCSPQTIWEVGYPWDTSKDENIIFSLKKQKF